MYMKKLIILLSVALLTHVSALSGHCPEFVDYAGEALGDMLAVNTLVFDNRLGLEDSIFEELTDLDIVFYEPVVMQKGYTHPIEGFWVVRYELTRESGKYTYNVAFKAQKGEKPTMIPMVMGTTQAGVVLLYDVLLSAGPFAYAYLGNGVSEEEFQKTFVVADTKVIEGQGDKWKEEWLMKACGKEISMIIEFTPDGQGGTHFNISQK